jgi:hypothetical protein
MRHRLSYPQKECAVVEPVSLKFSEHGCLTDELSNVVYAFPAEHRQAMSVPFY